MGSLGFVVVLSAVIAFALVSASAERRAVSAPMAFVLLGLAVGGAGLRLIDFEIEHGFVHGLAEVTLVLVLFSDASRIDLGLLRREHDLPIRLLTIGLPLTIVAGAVAAVVVLDGTSWPEAFVLAAVLAPTDAALGQAVVTSPVVPVRIRQTLNIESGLNDGITLPAVLFFVYLTGATEHGDAGFGHWLQFVALQLTLGPLVGIGVGWAGVKLLQTARDRGWAAEPFQDIAMLGLALLSFGLAEGVGGNGFIAAFVAGATAGNTARSLCGSLLEFMEAEGQLLGLLVFLVFGAALVPAAWSQLGPAVILYAVLSLTAVRMVPVAVSLIGSRVKLPTVLFLGWFGPRGLASILFALLVVEEAGMETGATVVAIVTLTVLLSVFAHGVSAVPGAHLYARSLHGPPDAEPLPERRPVTPMPTRFSK